MNEFDSNSSGHSTECSSDEILKVRKCEPVMNIPWRSLPTSHGTDDMKHSSHLIGRGVSWTGDCRNSVQYEPRTEIVSALNSVKGINSDFRQLERCIPALTFCQTDLTEKQRKSVPRSLPHSVVMQTEELNYYKNKEKLTCGASQFVISKLELQQESNNGEMGTLLLNEYTGYRNNDCIDLMADPLPSRQRHLKNHSSTSLSHNDPTVLSPRSIKQRNSDLKFHSHFDPEFHGLISEDVSLEQPTANLPVEEIPDNGCHHLMSRSIVQQCSDANDFQSLDQCDQEFLQNTKSHFIEPVAAGYDSISKQLPPNHDELLCRDQEIQELKEANCKQSQFIERLRDEKHQLESAVREQAHLIMSHGLQGTYMRSAYQAAAESPINFGIDSQVYEAQLTIYKEDFENERKEKLLLQSTIDSLKEQLKTVLRELNLVKEKLRKTEEELERHKEPFRRTIYQPSSAEFPRQSSSNSEQFTVASGQAKKPLYQKSNDLEPDRAKQNWFLSLSQLNQSSPIRTDHNDLDEIERKNQHFITTDTSIINQEQLCWVDQPLNCGKRVSVY